mmetsp:Transcript_9524/g.6872  ORF Transcript_9524/g.6872 Transcript_9524/m.6872 type:complete len:101 (+) Transcript_9524:1649-1951(+)
MVALCVEGTSSGSQVCTDDKSEGQSLVSMNVNGPLVCIDVQFRFKGKQGQKNTIANIRFGYLVDQKDVTWTNWAFDDVKYSTTYMNCVQHGIILGIRGQT